ncbi:MAG TPA: DUF3617 family protein [Candidatus Binatia bacterium]|nr:DUF3617 family protein [Candidatus Binatia bacterium]
MKWWSFLVAFSVVMSPFPGHAQSMPVEPGVWEFTYSIPDPLGGSGLSSVHRTCVRERVVTPARVIAQIPECRVWDAIVRGTSAKWKMRCTTQAGTMAGTGSLRSNTVSVAGSLDLSVSIGALQVPVPGTFKGRRIGKCR